MNEISIEDVKRRWMTLRMLHHMVSGILNDKVAFASLISGKDIHEIEAIYCALWNYRDELRIRVKNLERIIKEYEESDIRVSNKEE